MNEAVEHPVEGQAPLQQDRAAVQPPLRRAFIKSFGCQMNVYDADRMKDVLAVEGYGVAASVEDADLVILNTCHIRERATEKVFSELGSLRELKERREAEGLQTRIAVAGCVAQAEGGEIMRRQPAVDLVFGPQSYHRLPDILRRVEAGARVVETEFPPEDKFDHLAAPAADAIRARGVSAFVTIQEGCDKFCSFCVVPFTRGAETSRPLARILEDVERLVSAGVAEVTLIGQNVNAWRDPGDEGSRGLRQLFERLSRIDRLRRIRYATSHPNDFDDDLIAAHAELEKVMPFVHLPVQSGSDRILAAMNRRHTRADYLRIVDRLRRARPDIAMSSDFIVGFPGETEADFEATLDLMREVGFASAYSFKYSPRPGTKAAESSDQISEAGKMERLARLQRLEVDQRRAFNAACVGREFDVLFEKPGRHPGQIGGKTPFLQAVHVEGPTDLIGRIARVKILSLKPNSLSGCLL